MEDSAQSREVLVDSAVVSKKLHNKAFRIYGGISVLAGIAGFTPSIGFALTGVLWSVSNNSVHDDVDTYLWVHAVCMVVWFIAVVMQLLTGGTPRKALHRAGGYAGWFSLTFGQIAAAVWTMKYSGPVMFTVYTMVLVVMSVFNINVGCIRAVQRRTTEHKDHVLMALMWSLDPGFHRLSMWIIHIVGASAYLDSDLVLIYGKLPANFLLVALFGVMAVRGRRANWVTVPNIGLQFVAFYLGASRVFQDAAAGVASTGIWVATACGSAMLLAIVMALAAVDFRLRKTTARC